MADHDREDSGYDGRAWQRRLSRLRQRGKGRPRDLSPEEREDAMRRRRLTRDMLREAEERERRWRRLGE